MITNLESENLITIFITLADSGNMMDTHADLVAAVVLVAVTVASAVRTPLAGGATSVIGMADTGIVYSPYNWGQVGAAPSLAQTTKTQAGVKGVKTINPGAYFRESPTHIQRSHHLSPPIACTCAVVVSPRTCVCLCPSLLYTSHACSTMHTTIHCYLPIQSRQSWQCHGIGTAWIPRVLDLI
jgi:hypothetical protein